MVNMFTMNLGKHLKNQQQIKCIMEFLKKMQYADDSLRNIT